MWYFCMRTFEIVADKSCNIFICLLLICKTYVDEKARPPLDANLVEIHPQTPPQGERSAKDGQTHAATEIQNVDFHTSWDNFYDIKVGCCLLSEITHPPSTNPGWEMEKTSWWRGRHDFYVTLDRNLNWRQGFTTWKERPVTGNGNTLVVFLVRRRIAHLWRKSLRDLLSGKRKYLLCESPAVKAIMLDVICVLNR